MNYEIKPSLEKILSKIKKKDPIMFKAIINKIEEIVNSENPDHYKPLRHDLKNKKRVHILKSFVLIFSWEKELISFLDFLTGSDTQLLCNDIILFPVKIKNTPQLCCNWDFY